MQFYISLHVLTASISKDEAKRDEIRRDRHRERERDKKMSKSSDKK